MYTFLSKDDEFSVTVYVENQHGVHNKPVVIIRSPEKFKEVNSEEKEGYSQYLPIYLKYKRDNF